MKCLKGTGPANPTEPWKSECLQSGDTWCRTLKARGTGLGCRIIIIIIMITLNVQD